MKLLNKEIDKNVYQFRGKIAKFRDVGLKRIVLFTDVKIWSEENQKWEEFRDHMWCDDRIKNRRWQGKEITFKGQKYTYNNSIGKVQEAVDIKYPQLQAIIKKVKNGNNKRLQSNR